jgi:hypothetical protein
VAEQLLAFQEGLSSMELVNHMNVRSPAEKFCCPRFIFPTLNIDGIVIHIMYIFTVLKFLDVFYV